jgi:hypothetical protein
MNTPAFHCVKHPNRIAIKDVIINLKGICVPVKTDKQPFIFGIFGIFKITVILNRINSPPNICFAYAVLESGLTKLNVNIHVSSIPLKRPHGNARRKTASPNKTSAAPDKPRPPAYVSAATFSRTNSPMIWAGVLWPAFCDAAATQNAKLTNPHGCGLALAVKDGGF